MKSSLIAAKLENIDSHKGSEPIGATGGIDTSTVYKNSVYDQTASVAPPSKQSSNTDAS